MKRKTLLLCVIVAGSVSSWGQAALKPGSLTSVPGTAGQPALKGKAPAMVKAPQTISGVIPAEGPRATAITISGAHFGHVQSDVQVKINGVSAIITGVSDNQITAIVPDKAGGGAVSVGVKGQWASGGYFNYIWAINAANLAGGGYPGFADGAGGAAGFHNPTGIAMDQRGMIYVADVDNNRIRVINNFGQVTTLAGNATQGSADGTGTAAQFKYPMGVACDAAGNIYVADAGNNRIRKITPSGVVTTLAGSGAMGNADGPGASATFSYIKAIATDPVNGDIYVTNGNAIRKITPQGVVKTIAGVGRYNNQLTGPALSVSFVNPTGILVSSSHDIYVADYGTNTIRKISASGMVTIIAGDGKAGSMDGYNQEARFMNLRGIAMDKTGNLYVTEASSDYDAGPLGSRIRKIARDGQVTTPSGQSNLLSLPDGIIVDGAGNLIVADKNHHSIKKISLQ